MSSPISLKTSLLVLLAPLLFAASVFADPIRLEWQFERAEFIDRGGYARVKKLASGSLALVYSKGGGVYFRKQTDGVWSESLRVAFPPKKNSYLYTNAELAELSDGTLFFTWNARPDEKDGGLPYKIMSAASTDGGKTWGDLRDLYIAGDTSREGCWEPCPLQLSDGELQVWFANEHKLPRGDQNITVLRSRDGGKTWMPPVVACYRKGRRDGMPVPLVLKDGSLVFAIEDNGLSGTFKPVIIRPHDDFKKPVDGNSSRRWSALGTRCELPEKIYGGAPYIIRLDSGETVLSIQSTEGRRNEGHKFSNMCVYVGDSSAKKFDNPTTPLPKFPANAAALWNSLCQIDHDTLWAVASLSGLPKNNGVWVIPAKIIRNKSAGDKLPQKGK